MERHRHPADRAGEAGLRIGARSKPPVLGRSAQRWLCAAVLAVVFYGTLGPLGTAGGTWLHAPAAWSWRLSPRATDVNDIATNIVVYVPVGVALRWLLRRRGRAHGLDCAAAVLLAGAASYGGELLQQFMPHRTPSLTDVLLNGSGALLGAVLAVRLLALLRCVHERAFAQAHGGERWALAATIVVSALVALETMPWDLKRPVLTLGLGVAMETADPLRWARGGIFAFTAFVLTGAALARGAGRWSAVRRAALQATGLACAGELAQTVLGAHVASLLHALIATAGAWLGAAAALLCLGPRATGDRWPQASPAVQRASALLLIGLVGAMLVVGVLPATGTPGLRAAPAIQWLPLRSHFSAPLPHAAADLLAHGSAYALLAMLWLAAGGGRAAGLALLVGLTLAVEGCQAFQAGRVADTTPLLLALIAWAASVRLWRALNPPPAPRAIPAGAPCPVSSPASQAPAQAYR